MSLTASMVEGTILQSKIEMGLDLGADTFNATDQDYSELLAKNNKQNSNLPQANAFLEVSKPFATKPQFKRKETYRLGQQDKHI